ncbi:hypothetical protein ZIOFF_048127 [Zingiber officinale]|uniref:Uncharacterized protein n=1 Tax=Zingiber officinale TaxID=94328 RepID=A0A8J5G7B7_ZINOF|nr:hypothetical protein ZIOFF_048127 [Zingiber officinale]
MQSRPKPPTDQHFPNAALQQAFNRNTFKLIPPHSIDRKFYHDSCFEVFSLIEHYQLSFIVYCERSVNPSLVSEFYNNLHTSDGVLYRTRVAKRSLDFSYQILQEFLGCRQSMNDFALFGRPRPDGPLAHITTFSSLELSALDNALFKVVINCLLPIVSRVLALLRPSHMFLLFAMRHRLDVNIALNIFHCIIHFTQPVQQTVHMSFGNLIIDWLESMHANSTNGQKQSSGDEAPTNSRDSGSSGSVVFRRCSAGGAGGGWGLAGGRRGGRGVRPEDGVGEQDPLDGVDDEGDVCVEGGFDGGFDDAGGDVGLVGIGGRGGGDVEGEDAGLAGGLGGEGVAGGLEGGEGVVAGEDVEEHQLDLLLLGQGVESAGGEGGEGVVGGGEDGEAVEAVVELAVDLLVHAGLLEEANEGGELTSLGQDRREVERPGWGRCGGHRRLGTGGWKEQRDQETKGQ